MYIVRIRMANGKESCGLLFKELRNARKYSRNFIHGIIINREFTGVVLYDIGNGKPILEFHEGHGFHLGSSKERKVDETTIPLDPVFRGIHVVRTNNTLSRKYLPIL